MAHAVRRSPASAIGAASDLVGVLVVVMDVGPTLQRYVDDFATRHEVELAIYDQLNAVVARPGLTREIPVETDPHLASAREGTLWVGRTSGEAASVASYVPIAGTQWVMRTSVANHEALASVRQLHTSVLLIASVLGCVLLGGAVGALRALRWRRRAEENLLESQERTRTILETAARAYLEVGRHGLVLDCNSEAEVMLSCSRHDVIGQRVQMFFEDGDIVVAHMEAILGAPPNGLRRATEEGRLRPAATREWSTDGAGDRSIITGLDVDIAMWVIDGGGKSTVGLLLQDITGRKRFAEERELVVKRQRRLVEELRQADKAKTDFVSTVSHELRTPLTSITGYLEMLRDGFGGELTDQQTSMLDVIERNSRRLLGLIEDLLTLARIESGNFKMNPIAVDVGGLVTGAVQTLLPSVHENSLQFEFTVAPDAGRITGDPHQLERVLLNLVSNSVKFTPPGGQVSVTAFRTDDIVQIVVADTGIGVPEEEQHHLFGRFFRASTAQERALQGTGLGLTIVKSIVDRHGGQIGVRSAPGAGTTVTLSFPSTAPATISL